MSGCVVAVQGFGIGRIIVPTADAMGYYCATRYAGLGEIAVCMRKLLVIINTLIRNNTVWVQKIA